MSRSPRRTSGICSVAIAARKSRRHVMRWYLLQHWEPRPITGNQTEINSQRKKADWLIYPPIVAGFSGFIPRVLSNLAVTSWFWFLLSLALYFICICHIFAYTKKKFPEESGWTCTSCLAYSKKVDPRVSGDYSTKILTISLFSLSKSSGVKINASPSEDE